MPKPSRFKTAGKIIRAAQGEQHPNYAQNLNNLAQVYQATGRPADAEPLYRRAIEITGAALGEQHPDYTTYLSNLAGLYYATGRYPRRPSHCFTRCPPVRSWALGKDHPQYA